MKLRTPEALDTSATVATLLSDAPSDHDLLDYGAYRDAIASIIAGLPNQQLLTIGVFWTLGKWQDNSAPNDS